MGLGKRANQVCVRHCLVSLLCLIRACRPISHLCSAFSVEVEAKERVPSVLANHDSLHLQAVEGAAFQALAGRFEGHINSSYTFAMHSWAGLKGADSKDIAVSAVPNRAKYAAPS